MNAQTIPEITKKRGRGRPKAAPNCVCPVCGKEFHRSPSQQRTKKVFCSHKCAGKFHGTDHMNTPEQREKRSKAWRGPNNPQWKGGVIEKKRRGCETEILIRDPDHKYAWKSNGYTPLKYILLEKHFGRKIMIDEKVKLIEDDFEENLYRIIIYTGNLMSGLREEQIVFNQTFRDNLSA